jgi:hypothetical protein
MLDTQGGDHNAPAEALRLTWKKSKNSPIV